VIATSDQNEILKVEFSNGEKNLLTPEGMAEIEQALHDANVNSSVNSIHFTTSGSMFCGGLDTEAIKNGANPVDFARALVSLLRVFPTLTKPIAASIQGDALAGGSALVAVMDYAVSTPSARIGSHEVSLGIWPMIAQVPLVHRIGVRAALENIGSGIPFSATRAFEVGLIQDIIPINELYQATITWLTHAQRGSKAYAIGRPALYEISQLPYTDGLEYALHLFASMFSPNN
jgi:enoyl-CoA hydratase/carnithine racemase